MQRIGQVTFNGYPESNVWSTFMANVFVYYKVFVNVITLMDYVSQYTIFLTHFDIAGLSLEHIVPVVDEFTPNDPGIIGIICKEIYQC